MYSFLIIDTYYQQFLKHFYGKVNVKNKTYEEHVNLLFSELFGTANFYSKNLKKLGCEAKEIIFNDFELQYKWANEHGVKIFFPASYLKSSKLYKATSKIPIFLWKFDEYYKILKAQIKYYKPEILYIQDIGAINDRFLSEIKDDVNLIVGQIASAIPKSRNLKVYNLIFTSFPHFVKKFKDMGISAEYLKIAFEPEVLSRIGNSNKKYNCTFVGGITNAHKRRIKILQESANKINIDFFGYGMENVCQNLSVKSRCHGEVWGRDMYQVLAESKVTTNVHIDIAENYANNMRLYEATGCGAMLVTDYKDNLNEIFKIGKEVVCYRNTEELVELVKYYTTHDNGRVSIAKAGQKRTLKEHTYFNRMGEIIDILQKKL